MRRCTDSLPGVGCASLRGAFLVWISCTALAALLALPKSFAQATSSAQSSSDSDDTIQGTVINSVTHEPIARALVSSPDSRFATLTNGEGHFEFTIPKTGAESGGDSGASAGGGDHWIPPNRPYMLMARKPGFLQDPYNPGKQLQDEMKEVTLALIPEGLIVGTVSLPTSEAPDSITLELFRREVQEGSAHYIPAGQTQSTSDGQFRFAGLEAGTYKLLTSELMDRDPLTMDPRGPMHGYPPAYYQNAPDFASATTIQVTAGQTQTVGLSLVKQAYYRVKVPVMAADATGVGVAVEVYANGHKGPGFALGYAPADHAIEGSLPNGNYTIEAMGFGQGGIAGAGVQTITVKGAAIEGPSLALGSNAVIPVVVKEEFTTADQSGQMTWNIEGRNFQIKGPRRYLNIRLEAVDEVTVGPGGGNLRSPLGADDPLVLEVHGIGKYWVRVNSSRGYAASVRSGDVDLLHEPLTVGVGGTAPIEITMRDDWAGISGKVEGVGTGGGTTEDAAAAQAQRVTQAAAGAGFTFYQPISGGAGRASAHVYLVPLPDSSGQFTQIWVGPGGSFNNATVAPGAYRVLAFDRQQPQLEYRNAEAMRAYEGSGPVVRVSGGQKEQVTLQVIATEQ